ncbi:hypothetical protein KAM479c_03000 (plasmid) [Aeromonas caviae]|nr:hypothetical protein KAM479c_03000 [Aeromonas caviae]
MLISGWTLLESNQNLTPERLKWVLKNALHLNIDDLRDLKAKENATHPLLWDESIYDDLPVEALGPFVMEPYFPRKHFNRAFAGLFGKNSIAEINADDFSYYEALIERNECYTIGINEWMQLPFTRDEYDHLYAALNSIFVGPSRIQAYVCQHGLLRNNQLTLDIFEKERVRVKLSYSLHADSYGELADVIFDEFFSEFNSLHADKQNKPDFSKAMDTLKYPLQFKNLSRNRREEVLSYFGMENLELAQIHQIYNKAIPDDVLDVLISSGCINQKTVDKEMGIISDGRLPYKLATQIALSSPGKHAMEYFQRHDVDEVARRALLQALLETELKGEFRESSDAIKALSNMISGGVLTLPEIEFIQDRHYDDMRNIIFEWSDKTGVVLPPAIQDKWTKNGFCTGTQLRHYHDLSVVVESFKVLYTGTSQRDDDSTRNLENVAVTLALFNTRWTKELLLELLDVCTQMPSKSSLVGSQAALRDDIFKKLFGESFYPSLDREDLTGPYGRAENLLARLLDSDALPLSDSDINLIARSGIQLAYSDDEVDLATSLARHPALNEQIIAERLRLRVEQANDTPAPLARQRPAL